MEEKFAKIEEFVSEIISKSKLNTELLEAKMARYSFQSNAYLGFTEPKYSVCIDDKIQYHSFKNLNGLTDVVLHQNSYECLEFYFKKKRVDEKYERILF